MDPCCAPGHAGRSAGRAPVAVGLAPRRAGLVGLDGGAFLMGAEDGIGHPKDAEGPVRRVVLSPFRIAATAVTVAEFAAFVDATGHRTEAEEFGYSFVFDGFLDPRIAEVSPRVPTAPWWRSVDGATWRAPEGPGSDADERRDHPVTHVSWNDAQAYCAWSGTRLPTEAEWEYAARGGLEQAVYPWGDEFEPDGRHRANIWRGDFPRENTAADGHLSTAPAKSFEPNGFGLYNTVGNVWEWTADWFGRDHRPGPDPRGPEHGQARAMRGGSHMCHDSYCNRYRVAARSANTPDSSSGNIGFRVAA
ncbi:formylglycine-generating enzyme family protein [Glycomyces mayteni]|uniref:Formylglycine-generating enzyme family protein n=1 Tax=Glycomyces mayteni TaxID=543887 RepID=A0ABW2D855_9ACTN